MADVPIAPQPGEHPELHEHSDVSIRPIAIAGGALAGVILLSLVALFVLFRVYEHQQEALEQPASGVRSEAPRQTNPDIPPLQGISGFHSNTPAADMHELREREKQLLNSYGQGVDPGTARIPVSRAMDLAIERKLLKSQPPATQPTAAQATGGTTHAP